ncbi:MAG: hypothetical protein U0996_12475 [Planctomycetaceae bacterium]
MSPTKNRSQSIFRGPLLAVIATFSVASGLSAAQESPLAESGGGEVRVSFAEVIDREFGKGVTPEANALTKIYEAIGPRPEGNLQSEEYFRRLGIPVPPDTGNYFQEYSYGLTGEASRVAIETHDKAMGGPWTEEQFPELAKWLQDNQKMLEIIHEASLRDQWYYPVFDQKDKDGKPVGLIAMLLPHVQKMRGLARAFLIRSNLHLANNEPEKAWDDMQTCHRLGRLTARGPTLIDFLVGVAINSMASHAELRLLSDTKLTEKQIDRFLDDLTKLKPMPQVTANVNITERMLFNDCVSLIRDGHLSISELDGLTNEEKGPFEQPFLRALVDWGVVLKKGNEAYDELVAALEIQDVEKRRTRLVEIDQKWKEIRSKFDASSILKDYVKTGSASAVASDRMADAMISMLMPALRAVDTAQLRCLQTNQNLLLAFQLQKFKARTGSYPDSLEALETALSITVPQDLCTNAPLHYSKTDTGYLLYSVGTNGIDEGGKSWNDPPLNPQGVRGDDNVVRMPVPVEME